MTDTDSSDDDAGTKTDSNGSSGLGSLLRELVDSVANADQSERTAGRSRSGIGRGRIGHDVSIGVGTVDSITDADRGRVGDAGGGTTRTTGGEHPTTVQYDDGETEAIAVIDVPEIDTSNLSAGISNRNGDLLVGTDEAIVERVRHRLTDATIAAASYHNGVLELHLRDGRDRS
jgi:hypothetical protein